MPVFITTNSTMMIPTRSSWLRTRAALAGSTALRTRPPSSGGIGSRLNTARTQLITIDCPARLARNRVVGVTSAAAASVPRTIALRMARTTLVPGPASATSKPSSRGRRNQRGSIGTGLAHPKTKAGVPNSRGIRSSMPGTSTVPTGSTCASGFSVSRPARAAVGSPHAYATTPCATSCNTTATRSGTATIATRAITAVNSIVRSSLAAGPQGCKEAVAVLPAVESKLEGSLNGCERAPLGGAYSGGVQRPEHAQAEHDRLHQVDANPQDGVGVVAAARGEAEVREVGNSRGRDMRAGDRRGLAQGGELAATEDLEGERDAPPPLLAARCVEVERPVVVGRAATQVADAGVDAQVDVRVEPAVDEARRQREEGSDLAVAGAEAARRVTRGQPRAHAHGRGGGPALPATLEDAILGAHEDVGQVGRLGLGRRRAYVAALPQAPADVEVHVEGDDRDGDVHVEVVADPVGDVEGADRVPEIGEGAVLDRSAPDGEGHRVQTEGLAVRIPHTVIAEGQADVEESLAQCLAALGHEPRRHHVVHALERTPLRVPAPGVGRGCARVQREVADGLFQDDVGGVLVALVECDGRQPDQGRRGAIDVPDPAGVGGRSERKE